MIRLSDIQTVYFIGIGGIGMSALARYFHSRDAIVSGYDKTCTALTTNLEKEGIAIHYEDNVSLVPDNIDLVVFTPAIPAGHKELDFCREKGYPVLKRSDVLQIISAGSFNICVAGTHGKTTISTMIAHLLRHSGYGCNAFLGGISGNYLTNFWSSERNVCVIEADEYDRSFLKLNPDIAVISSMDADHLDIYGSEEALQEAFIDFSGKLKPEGLLLNKFGLKKGSSLKAARHLTYSLQNDRADVYATNIKMDNGSYVFDVVLKESILTNLVLNMGGMHNVENATVAVAVAYELEIGDGEIRNALADFKGVKRRFEYIIKTDKLVFIDDYAHHPEELSALITGAKTLFKGKKCTVIFQPHLFSRTKDFAGGFAESLDLADAVILLPIYPARELPVAGVTSDLILQKMKRQDKRILQKEEVVNYIKQHFLPGVHPDFGDIVIIAGAGDIDTLVQPVKEALNN